MTEPADQQSTGAGPGTEPTAPVTPTSSQDTARRLGAAFTALDKPKEQPAATEPVKQDAPTAPEGEAAPAPTAQAEDKTEPTAPTTTTPEPSPATQPTTQQPAESAEEKAARLERELSEMKAAQERQRVQGQTLEIQKAYQQAQAAFQKQVAPLVEQADDLVEEWEQARAEGDEEKAAKLGVRWNVLNSTIQQQQAAFQQGAKQFEQQFHAQRRTEHEQTLAAALKKQGLEYEEVKKLGGEKFDPTNPFAVLESSVRALTEKHKAELEKVKAESKNAVEEARKKWTLESPASRTGSTTSSSAGNPGRKLTTTEQLERGLANT